MDVADGSKVPLPAGSDWRSGDGFMGAAGTDVATSSITTFRCVMSSASLSPKCNPPREVHTRWVDEIGRNARCPCGSGKKFKSCHGSSHWRTVLLEAEQQFRRPH